jgi:hypothetical protein
LKEWARRCLAIYRNHPWFLEATSARHSIMGPRELLWMEAALAMLGESGLPLEDRHPAFLALIAHVRGHATFQQVRKYSGSPEQWTRELTQLLQSQAGQYPALLAAIGTGSFSESSARAFDFGLDCILEGIRARVARSKTKGYSGK